ncbi:hypothetical protein BLNAU_24136 [Blattamonas nauphoetae]|uniref:B30.2/SPRY domain-containing protein n=1 Tax=Blattamonas nauphoetae TaxID=2049346 RepID=A0ABQ9WSE8_9EUKA|nr:hypothetical protein BLNAU_24136 [Blattamonas nauphoetae]
MFKAATLSDVGPFNNLPTNSSNRSSTSAEEKSNQVDGPHGWDVDMMHLESNTTIFAFMHLVPIPLQTLPPMGFTDPSHFSIMHSTIVLKCIYCRWFDGLLISNSEIGTRLGDRVKNSVSLNRYGGLFFHTPSSCTIDGSHSRMNEGDCIRMEVDLDSTPRTVQFFVNGKAGRSYVSEIPSSVRIGFSVAGKGTSFRINSISRFSRPTPISEEMRGFRW